MKYTKKQIAKAIEATNVFGGNPFTYKEVDTMLKDFASDYVEGQDVIESELEDRVSEAADRHVDIYYHDLYKSVSKFSEDINEAISEFGMPDTLEKAIQHGQYCAYKQLFGGFVYELCKQQEE